MTTKIKHTPGPWYLDLNKNGGDWTYIIRQESPLPSIKPGLHIAELNKNLVRPETGHVEANARLIAAAPKMLLALKEAAIMLSEIAKAASIEKDLHTSSGFQHIMNAIEKAEGARK